LIIDAINEAINANKKISFQYFRYDASKKQQLKLDGKSYEITPLHLVWNGDYYYMIGVYDYKQKLGSFRVDRIAKRPEILDVEGTPAPEGFDINEHINTTFRMFNSPHEEVELICDNDVMDSIIDRFGEEVVTHTCDQNSFKAVVNVAVSNVFYSWIFGFGGKVKIKSPMYVKEQYAEMLRKAVLGLD
jgi:predicted DNA-binding transcriptional regulator YafY